MKRMLYSGNVSSPEDSDLPGIATGRKCFSHLPSTPSLKNGRLTAGRGVRQKSCEYIMWRPPQPQNLAKTEDSFAGVAVEFWVKASEDAVRLQHDKPGAK